MRKSDRNAYGVNGEPVVTLGIVEMDFKIDGLTFHHDFTVLRGLIHPMLLGMDFLVRYGAQIDLGEKPKIKLNHPLRRIASTPFLKAMPKPKQTTHIAAVKEFEIPPMSYFRADAYIRNISGVKEMEEDQPDKIFGITSTQKVNEFFDPGFMMRNVVISSKAESFKVELMNPWEFPIKVAEDTPLGAIFDYDCELLETNGDENKIWEDEAKSEEEKLMRKQTLLRASINVVTTNPILNNSNNNNNINNNNNNAPTTNDNKGIADPSAKHSAQTRLLTTPETMGISNKRLRNSPQPTTSTNAPTTTNNKNNTSPEGVTPEAQSWLSGSVKMKSGTSVFTMAYSDESESKLRYSDVHGEGLSAKDKAFLIDMEGNEYTGDQRKQVEEVLERNAAAFARNERETGCTDLICHHVKISDPRPAYLSYHKSQGPEIRKEIDDQTNNFLADRIVIESESPYCSPIVMVKKKLGGWRYCVDLRKINAMTEKQSFPMPRIEDALRKLKNPQYFSSMDLLRAYYQIPVASEDQRYYAFSDGRRHMQFARCPMGAKNSGSTLAMLMELVLRGLPPECVIGYLDDILLATEDWDTHMELLDKLLKSIIKAKLKLCPGKCQFGRTSAKSLGHTLTRDGIKPDKFNLDKIKQWNEAKNVGEVRTYLGLTGYYRSFIKNYAHIAAPLTDLLHHGREWRWEEAEKNAFKQLKEGLTSEPIASYPDFDKEFLLKTDASKLALGAVLTQVKDRKEHMIACMSKKFTPEQLRWATYDREFLSMILPVRHFSHYLRWNKFKLVTDHKPLLAWKDVTTQKDGSGKRTRWAMELSTYNVEVIYKEGKRHNDADALSRHPQPDEPDEVESDMISTLKTKEQGEVERLARELAKYQVRVIYSEKRKKWTEGQANANPVCTLTDKEEINMNFIAAEASTEIALVEIHTDDELGREMAKLQAEDEDLGKIIIMLKQNVKGDKEWKCVHSWYRHNRDGFVLSDDILYHVKKVDSYPEPLARMVIPKAKVKEMLFRCHGCRQSGHPGHKRAIARMEKFAIWQGMVRDVTDHVNRCAECQAMRQNIPARVAPIRPQTAIAPLQFIQADLFKTCTSYNGLEYICVLEDRYTKHCRLFALKDTKAKGVASCIETYVTQLGCPDVWGTDGGPEFYNALIIAMCHVFNIRKEFSLAYRPQSNGQTERKNRTLKAELAKRIHQFGKNWPSYLKWIELAYNTTPHPSHGFTPFMLMFGREARLPIQTSLPKIDTQGWQTTMKAYLTDLLDRMAKYQQQARINKAKYQLKMINQHDKVLLPPLEAGTQVLRNIPKQCLSKLDLPKDGPWRVLEQRVKDNVPLPVYRLQNEENKVILAHRENLSTFSEPIFSGDKPSKPMKSAKKSTQNVTLEGPASRTRAKTKSLLMLPSMEPTKATNNPVNVVETANDRGETNDSGGDDDGDDGAVNDDTDDEIESPVDDSANEEELSIGGEDDDGEEAAPSSNQSSEGGSQQSELSSRNSNESSDATSAYATPMSPEAPTSSEVSPDNSDLATAAGEITPKSNFKEMVGKSIISASSIMALMSTSSALSGTKSISSPDNEVFLPLQSTSTPTDDFRISSDEAIVPLTFDDALFNTTTEKGCVVEEVYQTGNLLRRSSRESKLPSRYES